MRGVSFAVAEKIVKVTYSSVLVILISKVLSVQSYGIYSYILSWVGIVGSFTNVGLSGYVAREAINSTSNILTLSHAYWLKMLLSVLGIISLFILFQGNVIRVDDFRLVLLGGLVLLGESNIILFSYLEAKKESEFLFYSSLFVLCGGLSVRFFVGTNHTATLVFLLILFLELLLFQIIYFLLGVRISYKISLRRSFSLLRNVSYFAFSSTLFVILGNIDQLFIGSFLSIDDLAAYALAYKIFFLTYVFMAPVVNYFYLDLASDIISGKLWLKIFLGMLVYSVIFYILFILFGKTIIFAVWGNEYSELYTYLKYLLLLIPVNLFNLLYGKYLWLKDLGKWYFIRSFIALLINLVANYILIHKLGIFGVIIGTSLASIWFVLSIFFEENKMFTNLLWNGFKGFTRKV